MQAGLWAQYALDNAAGVAEALDLLTKIQPFRSSHGHKANVHLALEDASGDSAIIEYIDGKPVVHHSRDFRVMTNDPSYDQQLELLKGQDFSKPSSDMALPGNVNPRDRFQRASYYLSMVPTPKTEREGVASVLAIMRNVSVPFGAPYKGFGVYNTEYRTVADTTDKLYFFELTTSPNVIWTDLRKTGLPPRRAGAGSQPGLARPQRRRVGRLPPRPRAVLRPVTPRWDRLGGDGRRPEFPANRENNREFSCSFRFCAKVVSKTGVKSSRLRANSLCGRNREGIRPNREFISLGSRQTGNLLEGEEASPAPGPVKRITPLTTFAHPVCRRRGEVSRAPAMTSAFNALAASHPRFSLSRCAIAWAG